MRRRWFGVVWAPVLLVLALAAPGVALGQAADPKFDDLAALRARASTPEDKRKLVAEALALTPDEAKKFWPVYDTFQRKLDASNRAYARAVQETTNTDKPISNAYARQFVREIREIEEGDMRAQRTLSTGVLKALPGPKAVRYLQIENKLRAAQRYAVATAMPLAKLP